MDFMVASHRKLYYNKAKHFKEVANKQRESEKCNVFEMKFGDCA